MEVSGRYLAAATTWPFLPPPISPDHLDGAGGRVGRKRAKWPVAEYEPVSLLLVPHCFSPLVYILI